ncbi:MULTISPECIES: RagB/SusD family nutrient uptake outer membrane protein [Chryseobacterium]|uniref:RagB/SusD family nutrient uptake outer membrane protein n=1 Tax=Chryseobacterium endophyticum TaxID=1854762 RepID=A0AAU6WQI5_9FLAO|nr:RagB/SusD family nutrient uptake outer membrane protein [uncultured Chryseobacterium sp.]
MKKYIYSFVVIAGLFTLSSCKGDFLETVPTDSVGDVSAVATAENLMAIVNGMHRDLYVRQNSNQGQNGQAGIMIMMDALGEDLVFPSTGNGWYITTVRWQDQINENGANDFYPYQFYYALIRNANTIINLGQNATGDVAIKNKAIAEAYAYRAFCHYMLVQLYSIRYANGSNNNQPGVPIQTTLDTAPKARNTVEEVYTQVNLDLDKAIDLLTTYTGRAAKSHFDINVVRGLKARVALTQGNYQIAADNAKLARSGYSLMSNAAYLSGFNTLTNNEWMWGSLIVADQTDYFGNFGAYMSRNYNSTNIRTAPKAINKLLYQKFPSTDVRTKNFDPTGQHSTLGLPSTFSKFAYTSQKFLAVSTSDSRCDVPLMRAAEMYLIEAEALARISGKEADSRVVFNQFMSNRNPSYVASSNTGTAYINEILDSRRIELWGEGFRFLDLKRLNLPLDRGSSTTSNHSPTVVNNIYNVPAGDKRWQYLIPKSEIDASNGLVVQNPL